MIINKLLIAFGVLCLASCTNRALYDNIRSHQREECLKVLEDYDACLERAGVNKSYEEYKREREALLEQQSNH